MAKMKKQGPPEFAGEMGDVVPVGRKGGSSSGNNKSKGNKKKKK